MSKTEKRYPCSGWEDGYFTISLNYKCYGPHKCKHAGEKCTENGNWPDGRAWAAEYYKVPRIVIAINEGGCATTGVCLDCILEAAKELEAK
jgi:hypothetical protein